MSEKRRLTPEEVKGIVFAPNDAVTLATATIRERRTTVGVGVRWGIPGVDDYLLPDRPGELIGIIGKTSNFKSGLMQYKCRRAAEMIREEQGLKECVVYVTWEQAIEEILAFDLATTARISATDIMQGRITDEQMDTVVSAGTRRSTLPLFLIGHSIAEGAKRPRLTLDAIGMALQYIQREYEVNFRAIFLDYLQQIESGEGDDRRMQVFVNVMRCKDMALAMRCPVNLATQAKREAYSAAWGVPTVADSMESSNFEHTCDKIVGVWMPKTQYHPGKRLQPEGWPEGKTLEVTSNLLILQSLKQRLGPAGDWWPLYVTPATNEIKGEMVAVEEEAWA